MLSQNNRQKIYFMLIIMMIVMGTFFRTGGSSGVDSQSAPESASAMLQKEYGQLPLSFEVNQGQVSERVKFLARGGGYTLFLTPTEAVLSLHRPINSPIKNNEETKEENFAVRMKLIGSDPLAETAGVDPLLGTVNYFAGDDPAHWYVGIPTFTKVRVRDVYPGIDLLYYGQQGELEYDFVMQEGIDPNLIMLEFVGTDGQEFDRLGNLVLSVGNERVVMQKPLIYQEKNGFQQRVTGGYTRKENGLIGFWAGAYDPSLPLVIDPVLMYATYLGGGDLDVGEGIAVDGSGSVYVTGQTSSLDFPLGNSFQSTFAGGGRDVFVAKLSPDGSSLVYATYLGGTGSDRGFDVTVDANGHAYLVGETESANFPTVNPFQSGLGGSCNAFVTKLDPAGSSLLYSTYLGGNGCDFGYAIGLDMANNIFVTGSTTSTNFPTSYGVIDTTCGLDGVCSLTLFSFRVPDAFITALDATGTTLIYSTYVGGSDSDQGAGIAVSATGSAYITGHTLSTDLPVVNAIQPTFGGNGPHGGDAFVVGVNATGSALAYLTYLGGSSTDSGSDIAADSAGNVYILGHTSSIDFPTLNALQPTRAGLPASLNFDAFVTKLDSTGQAYLFSTYLGGTGDEFAMGLSIDSANNVYVTGNTRSGDFPVASPIQATISGGTYGDAFVTKLGATGQALTYSTYLGGSDTENIFGGNIIGGDVAVDSLGNAYVTGNTRSTDFVTVNPFQSVFGGIGSDTLFGGDAYVVKIADNQPPTVDAGGPYYVVEGSSVVVTAGGNDPEQTVLTYAWDLDNNGSFETPGQSVLFNAAALVSPSSYLISVQVTDGGGLTATDLATVYVIYNFSGFFQPVDNLPTVNQVNAGRAIPVKFGLGGNQGLNIFAAGYPKSQEIACDSSALVDGIEETVTAGSSNLTYDPGNDRYTYVWKTEGAWEGTCRQLVIKLNDGAFHRANFEFQ